MIQSVLQGGVENWAFRMTSLYMSICALWLFSWGLPTRTTCWVAAGMCCKVQGTECAPTHTREQKRAGNAGTAFQERAVHVRSHGQ